MSQISTCYRHPGRETGVSCQRCDRYICTDCATPGAVGFLCPDDAGVRVKVNRPRFSSSPLSSAPVTMVLIAINVAVYLGQLLIPSLTEQLIFAKTVQGSEFGTLLRLFTSAFTHSTSSFTHILFNMYSLYILGTIIEPMLGKLRFIALYLLSVLGGGVAFIFLAQADTSVVGASGAIFGLMGAYVVFLRVLKLDARQMYFIIAINIFISFSPGISWQSHLGGFLVGAIVAYAFAMTRSRADSRKQVMYLSVIAVTLLALWFVANAMLPSY